MRLARQPFLFPREYRMPDRSERISAVITCRDYGHYLEQCLESVLKQTRPFDEVILIDDDSSDNTPVIAARYKGKVRYCRIHERNVSRARQQGFLLACGDFIVMIDSDDWLKPRFAEALLETFSKDPSLGIVYCGAEYVHEGDCSWFPGGEFVMENFHPAVLKARNYIVNCAMVRREAWLGQDPALSSLEDWDHWIRIVKEGWRAQLVPEKLFYYRIHEGSRTHRDFAGNFHDNFWKVKEKYLPYDITILLVLDGNKEKAERALKQLPYCRYQDEIQLLIADISADPAFHRWLLSKGIKAFCFPHLKTAAAAANGYMLNKLQARLIEYLKSRISGRYVFLSDYLVGFSRRLCHKLRETAFITAADAVSWSRQGPSGKTLLPSLSTLWNASSPLGSGAESSGREWDVLLIKTRHFMQIPFKSQAYSNPARPKLLLEQAAERNELRWVRLRSDKPLRHLLWNSLDKFFSRFQAAENASAEKIK